jgi:mannose-6-phosphate isomerase-like protein (cupin superfamily)
MIINPQQLFSGAEGKSFLTEVFAKKDLTVEYYKPVGQDLQQPHCKDEIYFICSGQSQFQLGNDVFAIKTQDFIFVPAHVPHRFVDFSEDFATWVVFFGEELSPP